MFSKRYYKISQFMFEYVIIMYMVTAISINHLLKKKKKKFLLLYKICCARIIFFHYADIILSKQFRECSRDFSRFFEIF